jgi:hypothetical protein
MPKQKHNKTLENTKSIRNEIDCEIGYEIGVHGKKEFDGFDIFEELTQQFTR